MGENISEADNSLKRSATTDDTIRKKVRLSFTAAEFRKQIKNEQKTQALQQFLQLINEGKQNVIMIYLEGGGSVIEILQLIEGERGVSPIIVFDVVNQMLLQISTKLSQYRSSAYDACRYFLNNFITLINKMLGLSSSAKERLATLKLLTTIVTCSAVLAKEILLHVNFNPTNLELLTKFSEVRTALIHFITAFLVDGHFPTLSVLLEKKGLMTSIIRGLQYDESDIVVLVLTAMKNHILENGSVTKTTKMKTFNTLVVRDIVNLYNWKGPAGLEAQKNKTSTIIVDEVEKSKVNEAVHSFLLVLCTSHKYGVIFKDPLIGLGKRQNSLMHTVLQSLERPWEHSYASELVIKICRACPDLAKTVWANLRPFLEPRWAEKWVKSVQFAERLLEELQPECIEPNNLNMHQMTQVITLMTSPLPILNILIPDNGIFEQPAIKHKIISLILKMAESIEKYLKHFDNDILRRNFANYIEKNFPDVELILKDWDLSDSNSSVSEYLDIALDLLDKYIILAPKILHDCNLTLDLKDLISKSDSLNDRLKVKTVSFLVTLEPTQFRPKSDLFQSVLTFSMEYYYSCKEAKTFEVLHLLLKNTGIFDGYETEIGFWINGILNQKNYDESIPTFLCNLIKKVDKDATEYNKKLYYLKNSNFSCMVLGLLDFEFSKAMKSYLAFVFLNIFHTQIDSTCFSEIVSKFEFLPTSLANYFENWNNGTVIALPKCKGVIMEHFSKFSSDFIENSLEIPILDLYPNFKLNLLQSLIFYLTNVIKTGNLRDNHKKNCELFLEQLYNENAFDNEEYVRTVLGNFRFLESINLTSALDFPNSLIINFVKHVNSQFVESYLKDFRGKIVASLSKIFRKPRKYENSIISLEILEAVGLDFEQCKSLISKFVTSRDNKTFLNVLSYCLNRVVELCDYNLDGLDSEIVAELSNFLSFLIEQEVPNLSQFSSSLHNYLKTFPESVHSVPSELFVSLIKMSEFNKDNLALCEFLLDRSDCWSIFDQNFDEICSKKGFILALLDVIIKKKSNDDIVLEKIFNHLESHITKILQKPHKAGQHFQNRYNSVGILIEKFMKPDGFGTQIQKFETTELFHVYLLKKVFDKVEDKEKVLRNMVMTFIHLLVNLLKQKKENLDEIGQIFYEFLSENGNFDVILSHNETFKTFYKLCLKHGVSGDFILLKISSRLVRFCLEEDAKLMLDMLMSHSQFLDVVLGVQRHELLGLWFALCSKWPQFMERNHIPVLLAAYKATRADTTALELLRMYESKPGQKKFFDFKPFLWGRAAASHYSVRSDIQKALWRQPRMADVLNNLHQGTITSTITDPSNDTSYDLDYFLPLFSQLLSPENPVATYHFTKSGALALALVGLRGDKSQRLATCHVLQRFYFHLEARQSGKDNLLWLRFIEAICKGIAVFDDFQINNFVGVFLARTALILAQPTHVMYVPLTQYLAAKDSLDFSTVPELYTFLHSPHTDSREHKHFILEILRDGLKNEKDFGALLRSMGFKLISELLSSTVCDFHTKILILEIFEKCCRIKSGIGILCGSLSFLAQMSSLVLKEVQEGVVLGKLLDILLRIVEVEGDRHRNFIVFLNLMTIVENEVDCQSLKESKCVSVYFEILLLIYQKFPNFFTMKNVNNLMKLDDKLCKKFLIK